MEERIAKMPDARITEDMIREMRSKKGLKLRTEDCTNNEEATRIAILKFADGIGDTNPLWRKIEYAKKTKYGSIIAPPSFLWACISHVQFGWKGIAGFHSGCDIEFFKPVYLNDKVTGDVTYRDFEGPKSSEFAEEMVIDHLDQRYWNQDGEPLAKYHNWVVRIARGKAREKGKYSQIKVPHPWTEEELKKIEEEVLSEEIRGANPRYWEDVQVGDVLKPVVKGPLGLTDEIAFFIGGAAPIPRLAAHGVSLRQYRAHPAWAFRDPETSALEPIFAVHYNRAGARGMGNPMQYDVGLQRHCWGIHLMTNWMGDDGWLKRSYTEYRRFNYFGDVVWIKGTVTKKYIDEDGEHCVHVERHAINQRGEDIMPGYAVVALPSKEKRVSPLDGRIRQR
jgi:acyl dehydratase